MGGVRKVALVADIHPLKKDVVIFFFKRNDRVLSFYVIQPQLHTRSCVRFHNMCIDDTVVATNSYRYIDQPSFLQFFVLRLS